MEDVEKRLVRLWETWAKENDALIVVGTGKSWVDIEADETTFPYFPWHRSAETRFFCRD